MQVSDFSGSGRHQRLAALPPFEPNEVIAIPYIFKPRTRQVDEVAEVVKELQARGLESLTISRFYEYAAERAVQEYRQSPNALSQWISEHRRSRGPSDA